MPRPPGRSPIGPRINVRFDRDLLERIDTEAASSGESRAATIRRLVDGAVGDTGVDVAQIRRALELTPAQRIRVVARSERALAGFRGRASP